MTVDKAFDVIVVGGGNAALCAALTAREAGATVLVLEKAPEAERGGNSLFTAGGFRFAHRGLEDLRQDVLVDLTEGEARAVEVRAYTEEAFYDDLARLTENLTNPDLAEWGGLNVEAVGGGPGLVQSLYERAERVGIRVRYGTGARRLLVDGCGRVTGVVARGPGGFEELPARAVVLACGGFEANPEWRARYLGPDRELARVRGTRTTPGTGSA